MDTGDHLIPGCCSPEHVELYPLHPPYSYRAASCALWDPSPVPHLCLPLRWEQMAQWVGERQNTEECLRVGKKGELEIEPHTLRSSHQERREK